jgi:hypothetical protein
LIAVGAGGSRSISLGFENGLFDLWKWASG